jgi:hypothetical protein
MADRIINHEAVIESTVNTSNVHAGKNFTQIESQKQIELAADSLARILIQQVMNKKNLAVTQQIETKYGKQTR